MRYIAQIMAVFNWLHKRRWAWIFGNAVNGMGGNAYCVYGERKDGDADA